MSATQRYKNVTSHNGRFTWQLSILGKPCRTKEHWDDPASAAIDCDLVKFYLRTVFKLELSPSMDPEHWTSAVYSSRNVILSNNLQVEAALPDSVKVFVVDNFAALEAHRDAQPEETTASKIRRSEAFSRQPELREWVAKYEAAELTKEEFSKVNIDYLGRLLDSTPARLTDALPALRRAVGMLSGCTDAGLVSWRAEIEALIAHLSADVAYLEEFSARLKSESVAVFTALQTLESARPSLTFKM